MRELRARFFLRLTTFVTLTACFTLLAVGSLGILNLSKVLSFWGEEIQITAYLATDLVPSEVDQLKETLTKDARIAKVELISQEKALQDFQTQMASYAPDLVSDPDLFSLIPPSFQISLNEKEGQTATSQQVTAVANSVKAQRGIEEVRYGQEWIEKYGAFLSLVRRSVGVLALIIGLATILVIGNSVRASVDAHRSEVEVLELVGATAWMIRKPFMIEGASLGGLSVLTALGLTGIGYVFLKKFFRSELQFFQLLTQLQFLPISQLALFLAFGVGVGALASYMCVRRLNDGFAAAGGGKV